MKKFRNWYVCVGTGSFLTSFILIIYELMKAYKLLFLFQIGALLPVIIFVAITSLYFIGNIIFTILQKWFDRRFNKICEKTIKQKMTKKSPLRLPNGKFRVKEEILAMIPEDIIEFRDVRMSSGHISFHVMNNRNVHKYWLNDENADVVNFFKYASYFGDDVEKTVKELMSIKERKELFIHCKEILAKEKSKSIDEDFILEAAAFFIINRLSYAGTLTGGYCDDNWVNGKTPRLTKSAIDRMRSIGGFVKSGVQLTSMDYRIPLTAPTSCHNKKDVFLFINPPFMNKNMQMYVNSKTSGDGFDYEKLASLLCQTDYRFLMVIDDCKKTRELFSFGNITPLGIMNGDDEIYPNKPKDGELVIITNY